MIWMKHQNGGCIFLVALKEIQIAQDGGNEARLSEMRSPGVVALNVNAKKVLNRALGPNQILLTQSRNDILDNRLGRGEDKVIIDV